MWDATKAITLYVYCSPFYQNLSLYCEIFFTNHCFLYFDMMPFCWKPFRYQETSVSCKIYRKKVQSKHLFRIKYIFKIAANQRNILHGRERNHLKNRYSSVFYFHVVLFKMRERDIVTENNLILYYS